MKTFFLEMNIWLQHFLFLIKILLKLHYFWLCKSENILGFWSSFWKQNLLILIKIYIKSEIISVHIKVKTFFISYFWD